MPRASTSKRAPPEPTAFCATWGEGGPVIGGYAEYDVVPGRSQAAVPYRKPREGYSKYAAGHTDPHSALGIGSLTGFLAAKHAIERHGLTARLKFFGEPADAQPSPDYCYPEWTKYALAGFPASIDPMWFSAGRVIAATILDLVCDPATLAEAKEEFEARTGGGIGGAHWLASLLPKDFRAPVDYSWPEYVETPRGREWCLRDPPTRDRA